MEWIDYAIIVGYLVGMLALGSLFRNSEGTEDYFLGGRKFGWFTVGLSVMATQLSAVSFLSVPAFVGARPGGGLTWISTELHAPLTALVLMFVLIPPLFRSGVISIYDFLEERLGKSTRQFISSIFLVNRALATDIAINAVCIVLEEAFGFSFLTSLLGVGVVTVVYSWQGGMKAVMYGDAAQMIILFLGLFLCIGYGYAAYDGWADFTASIDPTRTVALDFEGIGIGDDSEFGFWPLLIGGLFISVAYYGTDQSEAQRFLSAKDLPTVRKSLVFIGIARFPIIAIYAALGLIVGPLVFGGSSSPAAGEVDRMIPVFIMTYLPTGVRGILVVAILASAMSSLSSAVNSLSAVSVQAYRQYLLGADAGAGKAVNEQGEVAGGPSLMKLSRLASLVWGVLILLVTVLVGGANETMIVLISQIGSISFGPILGAFVIAITQPGTSARWVNVSVLAGIALNVCLWQFAADELFWIWWNVTGFFTTYLLSLFTLPRTRGRAQELDLRPDWKALRSREAMILGAWFLVVLVICYWLPFLLSSK